MSDHVELCLITSNYVRFIPNYTFKDEQSLDSTCQSRSEFLGQSDQLYTDWSMTFPRQTSVMSFWLPQIGVRTGVWRTGTALCLVYWLLLLPPVAEN